MSRARSGTMTAIAVAARRMAVKHDVESGLGPGGVTLVAAARPRKVDDAEHITTAKKMKADGHTGKDIAKYLGVFNLTVG